MPESTTELSTPILPRLRHLTFAGWGLIAALSACSDSPAAAVDPGLLSLNVQALNLGDNRVSTLTITNPGGRPVGPVTLTSSPISGSGGATLPGSGLVLTPSEITTLNPGQSATFEVRAQLVGTLLPGDYHASVTASSPSGGDGSQPLSTVVSVTFAIAPFEGIAGVTAVQLVTPPTGLTRGDPVTFSAEVRVEGDQVLQGAPVGWSVLPADLGYLGANGQFVAYRTGTGTVVARAGDQADSASFTVADRTWSAQLSLVGQGTVTDRISSDLWLHGDFAYTGTHVGGAGGNTLYVWDISNPQVPVLSDSVRIDARVVNDVKVRADGSLAVITHEGSNDGLNGVTLLDLSDPGHPRPIGRYTDRLETGIHNAWLEGDILYLVTDGAGQGLRVLDVSDPENPTLLSEFSGSPSTFLHDVYVRDGLAFLSHWDAGLIVLDVGNGIKGGSPQNPVEVSRIETAGGQTHNAWYWPEAGYVFVGEEDFQSPGIMHVVDFRDPENPAEVATFTVSGTTPHNFWLDEDQGLLHLAWYGNGLRVLDVNGELLGELDRQGREVASTQHQGAATCSSVGTCTWAPQLHRGLIYVSDMGLGLSILELLF